MATGAACGRVGFEVGDDELAAGGAAALGVVDAPCSDWGRTFADGDTWDGSVDLPYWTDMPIVAGPDGRLWSAFYRGFALSEDDGLTWARRDLSELIPAGTAWPRLSVSIDGDLVFLYVPEVGVLRSVDGGVTFAWVDELSAFAAEPRGGVAISPHFPEVVVAIAGYQDLPSSIAGDARLSRDGGVTWSPLGGALALAGADGIVPSQHPVAFDPDDPERFWVVDMPEGAFETTDGGATFAAVPGATTSFANAIERSADDLGGRLILTGACSSARTARVGGGAWGPAMGADGHCMPAPFALADPSDLRVVVSWQGHDDVDDNLRRSTDGGQTLAPVDSPDLGGDVTFGLAVAGDRPGTFFSLAVTPGAGTQPADSLLRSTDGGATFVRHGAFPACGI